MRWAALTLAGLVCASCAVNERAAVAPSGEVARAAEPVVAPPVAEVALPARVPIARIFASGESNFHYRISPDGARLAWLAPAVRRTTILTRTLPDGPVRVVETGSSRNVRTFEWAADSRRLLFVQDVDGDENNHIYLASAEMPGEAPRDLTPWPGSLSWVARVVQTDPSHVIVGSNRRDPSVFDLWRVDLDSGESALVARNPGDVVEWLTDWHGRPVTRLRHEGADARVLEVAQGEAWTRLLVFDLEEMESRMLGVTADGGALWMLSSRGRERRALVQVDLASGAETVVAEDPIVDIEWVTLSRRTREPVAVFTHPDYPRVRFLHPPLAAAARRLESGAAGLSLTSLDDDDRRFVVQRYTEKGYETFLLDAEEAPRLLGRSPSMAFAEALGSTAPIVVEARDGLRLPGYLTQPPGYRAPGPLVIFVHGGHWLRDYWGYNPPVQFLANRGYAVLQVNYRGSTGYGRRFMEAAIGEYAGKMHDDLVDAVRWAVERGVADPRRVAIYGGSYGGYAALVGMTFTPDVFACGVSVVGMSNLVTLVENSPSYWKLTWRPRFIKYMGDPSRPEDRARLEARSPLFKADQVRNPILIIHGARDQRVKLSESEQMVEALHKAGKEVRYVVLPDEGHLWSYGNTRNALRHYAEVETFLDRCLAPR